MIRIATLVALLTLALAPRADAQPAFALGHPLPAADLENGTVSVRVIAGSVGNPVGNAEVTLIVGGTPQVTHSDDAGRAFFKGLPANARVQAKISGEDKQDVISDEFDVPASGGVKVMLSTKPMEAGGAPFAGGGGGMPEPRQLSGQPRPEKADPPGSYTVRLTYDDLKDPNPPAGIPVALVGYSADDHVSVTIQPTDQEGRAQFVDLDRSGATSYFAFTQLPRNGAIDRLVTQPVVMLPQVGLRAILSSEKRDSKAPPLDDLVASGEAPTPAGKVRVALGGLIQPSGDAVEIYDAASHAIVAHGISEPGPPDPTQIEGGAPFTPLPDKPAGTLEISAHGGVSPAQDPLPHIGVRVVDAKAANVPADAPSVETGADGTARLTNVPPGPRKAAMSINGRQFITPAFDLSKAGGKLDITAQWASQGPPEAVIDLAPKPGQLLYAQITVRGQQYRSRPFELVDGRGVRVLVQALPRVMFSFSWTSRVDDDFFNVQGRFEMRNNSWAPYVAGKDGLLVPLPKGFTGGILADDDKADVAVVPGEGFRLVRPLPPGERRFLGGFSLPVDGGTVDWNLDLPYGAYESGMEIADLPTMQLKLPPGVKSEPANDNRGAWRVLPNITILPRQSMAMTVSGLPTRAAWSVWMPRLVGALVLLLMIGGLSLALVRARRERAADAERAPREARRQQLLDELVELEATQRSPKQNRRREAVLAELERLWDS